MKDVVRILSGRNTAGRPDETRRGQQQTTDRQADRRGCHVRALQNEWRGERGSLVASKPQPGAVRRSEDVHTWERGRDGICVLVAQRGGGGGRKGNDWLAVGVCLRVHEVYTLQAVIIVEGLPLL